MNRKNIFQKIWDLLGSAELPHEAPGGDVKDVLDRMYDMATHEEPDYDRMLERTKLKMKKSGNLARSTVRYAAVFMVLIAGAYFVGNALRQGPDGGDDRNTAISLTLPDGTTVDLDELKNAGSLPKELAGLYERKDDGIISCHGGEGAGGIEEPVYHLLEVPDSRTYSLQLSDGSTIWLNSGTKLRYPLVFARHERRVELVTGEIFLDVEGMEDVPFILDAKRMSVEVLGTRYNVNAYPENDGLVFTTLVSGRVKVSDGEDSLLLNPGEQSVFGRGELYKQTVDIYEHTSWMDGLYIFRKQPFEKIVSQIERWYGVTVELGGGDIGGIPCTGMINRDNDLIETLETFKTIIDMEYKITGNRVRIALR